MSASPEYVIFSSIGSVMTSDTDPIYEVAHKFPPVKVLLYTSDEPPERNRESSEVNIANITAHFKRMKVPVSAEFLDLEEFNKNVFAVAGTLIETYLESDKSCQLLIDISAGRGVVRQTLSRAAEIAKDTIQSYYDPDYYIMAAIRSKNRPIVDYKIGLTAIPDQKDVELLFVIDKPWTQTRLSRELNWNNQSEVSKAVQRLEKAGLIVNTGHKNRTLTEAGINIREYLKRILS